MNFDCFCSKIIQVMASESSLLQKCHPVYQKGGGVIHPQYEQCGLNHVDWFIVLKEWVCTFKAVQSPLMCISMIRHKWVQLVQRGPISVQKINIAI